MEKHIEFREFFENVSSNDMCDVLNNVEKWLINREKKISKNYYTSYDMHNSFYAGRAIGEEVDENTTFKNMKFRYESYTDFIKKYKDIKSNKIDYSLKAGDKVWFTFMIQPKKEEDWIEAEIIDINWALKAAAIKLKGYKNVSCYSLSGLSREKYITDN